MGGEDALVLKQEGSEATAQLLPRCLLLIPSTHILKPLSSTLLSK